MRHGAVSAIGSEATGEFTPCDVGAQLEPLVPQCSLEIARNVLAERGTLVLNSGLRIAGTTVWVADPVSSVVTPYRLGPDAAVWLKAVSPGREAGSGMPEPLLLAFVLAGILIHPRTVQDRRCAWEKELRNCRHSFEHLGYAAVRDILPPLFLGGLRRHYRELVRSGSLKLGDGQSRRRYVAHNETAARFVHHQLLGTMRAITGLNIKPSYVYLACYLQGASLPRHVDRQQCEYSISLCLDYGPEPKGPTGWPLWLDTAKGAVAAHQSLGDALFYRGCLLPHFRTQFTSGEFSTSLFLHYVDEHFTGPLI